MGRRSGPMIQYALTGQQWRDVAEPFYARMEQRRLALIVCKYFLPWLLKQ